MNRPGWSGQLRKFIFGLSLEEATFVRRGFWQSDTTSRQCLECIGYTFLFGYHAALEENETEGITLRLNTVDPELRGFAFEGTAMALALLDLLTPWRTDRFQVFLAGPGQAHLYMMHVGAGWALARLHRRVEGPLARFDPLLRWLAIDGYGFHEGYFYWRHYIRQQASPKQLAGVARRVFDQGLGRSLWFVEGADINRILATIAAFPLTRQADLWSGVGLACAYAGGVERTAIETLRAAAGSYASHLAQGAAFAAKARQRAGNPALHTVLACEIFCGLSADEAAMITDVALQNLPPDNIEPAYEVWRRRIRTQFTREGIRL